jgi:hypothetical protein
MKLVCLQCHSSLWTDEHFSNFDQVVYNYNNIYYTPIRTLMDTLYEDGLLSAETYFDEPLEWAFYELWHHEGRRARMGAAMMAPDYAWWHGFYELKHRYSVIVTDASALRQSGSETYSEFPGKFRP